MNLNRILRTFPICLIVFLGACTSIPKGVMPVNDFDVNRYLGTWYEIARLDHRFERGLSKVSAEYSLLEDGNIRVLNSGFSDEKQELNTAEGIAKFVAEPNLGHLKVSFFGPFYGSYVVFELDDNYEYAFVSGYNKKYLWLLSRTTDLDSSIVEHFKARAEQLGFNTDELIYVEH